MASKRQRAPLGKGDKVDPLGLLHKVNARAVFFETINEIAPECVRELFDCLPEIVSLVDEGPVEEIASERLVALTCWASRWHLDQPRWILRSAHWCLRHYVSGCERSSPDGVSPPARLVYNWKWLGERWAWPFLHDAVMSQTPGWRTPSFEICVPQFQAHYDPLQDRQDAIRQATHEHVDRWLDARFAEIEGQTAAYGAVDPSDPILIDHVAWTVRWLVLGESIAAIARDTRKHQGAIRHGIQRVAALAGLPTPSQRTPPTGNFA